MKEINKIRELYEKHYKKKPGPREYELFSEGYGVAVEEASRWISDRVNIDSVTPESESGDWDDAEAFLDYSESRLGVAKEITDRFKADLFGEPPGDPARDFEACPSSAEAVDWLRTEHRVVVVVDVSGETSDGDYLYFGKLITPSGRRVIGPKFHEYQDALDSAVLAGYDYIRNHDARTVRKETKEAPGRTASVVEDPEESPDEV